MVTGERLHFTFSLSAPVATNGGDTGTLRRVARRTVRTMQTLLDRLPPTEVELVCSRIDVILQQGGSTKQDAVVAQMTDGPKYGVP